MFFSRVTIIFVLTLLPGLFVNAIGQSSTGIHLTMKKKEKNCGKQLMTPKKQKVCIAELPIITIEEFSYITPVKQVGKAFSYFNIILSEKGFDKLKMLYGQLPNAQFALVVDDNVVGFIKNMNDLRNRTLQIDGEQYADVTWVYDKLKTKVPEKSN